MLTLSDTVVIVEREKVIRQRTEKFFHAMRYPLQQSHVQRDGLGGTFDVYGRGSRLSNFWAMNPASWKVQVFIRYQTLDEATEVTVEFCVDTIGQIVMAKEEDYWKSTFQMCLEVLETGKTKSGVLNEMAENVTQSNYQLLRQLVALSSIGAFVAVAVWAASRAL